MLYVYIYITQIRCVIALFCGKRDLVSFSKFAFDLSKFAFDLSWSGCSTFRCFIMFRDGPSLVTERRSEAWAPYYWCHCWSINMADLPSSECVPSSDIIICSVNDTINHRLLLLSLLFMLFLKQKLKFRREMMAKSWSSERQAMSSVKWSLPLLLSLLCYVIIVIKGKNGLFAQTK